MPEIRIIDTTLRDAHHSTVPAWEPQVPQSV